MWFCIYLCCWGFLVVLRALSPRLDCRPPLVAFGRPPLVAFTLINTIFAIQFASVFLRKCDIIMLRNRLCHNCHRIFVPVYIALFQFVDHFFTRCIGKTLDSLYFLFLYVSNFLLYMFSISASLISMIWLISSISAVSINKFAFKSCFWTRYEIMTMSIDHGR